MSKTVPDRTIITIEHKQEVMYDLSNSIISIVTLNDL